MLYWKGENEMRSMTGWNCLLAIGCLFLLTGCSSGPTKAASQPSANTNGPTKLTKDEEEILAYLNGEKWRRDVDTDKMDGHKSVSFSSVAVGTRVPNQANHHLFVIECDPKLELFIVAGNLENGDVRIKFDDDPPVKQKWGGASYGQLFPPNHSDAAFLKKLLAAQTFNIEYTPLGEAPVIRTYKTS